MQRHTATTFGELRQGDRFYFVGDKQKIAYQVTLETLSGKQQSYNQVDAAGKNVWIHDKQAPGDKPVIFLRHTRPAPGDEWLLKDLSDGDVFYVDGDIITEYQVIKNRHGRVIINLTTSGEKDLPDSTVVVFVKKRESVKVD